MKKFVAGTLVCILALLTCNKSSAQTPGLGTWNIVNAQYHLTKQWGVFAEVQARSQKFFNNFSYHELKTGVSYNLSKNLSFLLGTGQYVTYNPNGNFESPVETSEFRIWEQLTLTNNLSRVKLEHRYRIEQRSISGDYRNRFRYRLNAIVPLNNQEIKKNTVLAMASGEIFLTNTRPYFERTRLSGGAGYVFSDLFTLQIGWIQQFDYRKDNTTRQKDFLQTTLLFNINPHQTERKPHPSSMD